MMKILIENLGCTIEAKPSLNLLNNFILNKAPIHTVCGGRARCGCCRIKIMTGKTGLSQVNASERMRLGDELIEQGWRLSCQTHTLRDITIHMPSGNELEEICTGSKG